MILKYNLTMLFASVCIILLTMKLGVLRAENPTNSSQVVIVKDKEIEKTPLEKGMEVLYDMTNGFLGTVQPERLYDQRWINLTYLVQGKVDIKTSQWQEISSYALGYSICLAVGVLFALIMPFVGCCFCCCRCAGRCGGKRKLRDPKRAKCKRNTYCTILLILNTISLAGVVCAFVTNDIIHRKVENEDNKGVVGNLNSAISELQIYVNDTAEFLGKTALEKYDSATLEITRKINQTADNAVDQVLKVVNASAFLDQAKALANKSNNVLGYLNTTQTALLDLKTNGEELSKNLTKLKNDVQLACNTAGGNSCDGLDFNQYKTDANFSQLSELSTEIEKVKDSLNISEYINEAESKIAQVKSNSTDFIKGNIDKATNTMNDIRGEVESGIDDYKSKIQVATQPFDDIKGSINSEQSDIKKFGDYVWYAGIGISCIFLLIILFYYLGVLFGACGERPGHGAACCNTSVGGNLLMAGAAFSFLFASLLMIICFILFIPGGIFYTELCRYFQSHDPQLLKPFDDQVFSALPYVQTIYNRSDVNFSIVQILTDCKNDKAIYTALQLQNIVNLDNLLDLDTVDKELDSIKNNTVNFNNITILTNELRTQIENFGNSGLNAIDYAAFETEINKNLTAVDLKDLAAQLDAKAATSTGALQTSLTQFAVELRAIDTRLVEPMKTDVKQLNTSLNQIKKNSNVKNETDALIIGLENAQDKFNTEGVTLVNDMIKGVTTDIKSTLKTKTDEVKSLVSNDAGKCRPVYDAFYLLTDAACVVLLNPLNGFWFSMGWCLFFFIPSIIFAVKLSTLYHREEEYVHEKVFDEANFSMYAGPNPDTIPLTSSSGRRHDGYGAQNTGYRDDGYRGKSSNNGYPAHAESPPAYDDRYRGERNGNRQQYGRPQHY